MAGKLKALKKDSKDLYVGFSEVIDYMIKSHEGIKDKYDVIKQKQSQFDALQQRTGIEIPPGNQIDNDKVIKVLRLADKTYRGFVIAAETYFRILNERHGNKHGYTNAGEVLSDIAKDKGKETSKKYNTAVMEFQEIANFTQKTAFIE